MCSKSSSAAAPSHMPRCAHTALLTSSWTRGFIFATNSNTACKGGRISHRKLFPMREFPTENFAIAAPFPPHPPLALVFSAAYSKGKAFSLQAVKYSLLTLRPVSGQPSQEHSDHLQTEADPLEMLHSTLNPLKGSQQKVLGVLPIPSKDSVQQVGTRSSWNSQLPSSVWVNESTWPPQSPGWPQGKGLEVNVQEGEEKKNSSTWSKKKTFPYYEKPKYTEGCGPVASGLDSHALPAATYSSFCNSVLQHRLLGYVPTKQKECRWLRKPQFLLGRSLLSSHRTQDCEGKTPAPATRTRLLKKQAQIFFFLSAS